MGQDKTSKISTFVPAKDKGAIDEIVRGLGLSLDYGKEIKTTFEEDEDSARSKYKDVMRYFDGIKGVILSRGEHPAGMIASPITLSDNLGLIKNANNEDVSCCDMKIVDSLNYVKLDILGLKNMAIIKDTYAFVNTRPLAAHEIDFDDKEIWDEIISSPYGIFQFERENTFKDLKRFRPLSLDDMTVVNAAIRPSGASFRDKLFQRITHKNPSTEIDEILKESYGYLAYQEQTINFLQIACGFSGPEADSARRAI